MASVSPVSSVPKSYPANLADSHRFTRVGAGFTRPKMQVYFLGTDCAENAERHGLFFKYKAVASVSPVSSVPKSYPADSHRLVF